MSGIFEIPIINKEIRNESLKVHLIVFFTEEKLGFFYFNSPLLPYLRVPSRFCLFWHQTFSKMASDEGLRSLQDLFQSYETLRVREVVKVNNYKVLQCFCNFEHF